MKVTTNLINKKNIYTKIVLLIYLSDEVVLKHN